MVDNAVVRTSIVGVGQAVSLYDLSKTAQQGESIPPGCND